MGTQGRGAQPSGGAPHAARLAFGEAPIFKAPRGIFHLNDKQKALPGVPEQEVYFGPTQAAVLDQETETLASVIFEGMGFRDVARPAAFRGEKDVHRPNLPPSGSGSRL